MGAMLFIVMVTKLRACAQSNGALQLECTRKIQSLTKTKPHSYGFTMYRY